MVDFAKIRAAVLLMLVVLSGVVVHRTFGARENQPVKLRYKPSVTQTNIANTNCRYGVATSGPSMPWLPTLNVGWYVNFTAASQPVEDVEFVHILRVRQDRDGDIYLPTYTIQPALTNGDLGTLIDQNPGALWLVGNEPDVSAVQDDTFPDVYARAYHEVYEYIKQRDATAQLGIAGLSMMTPGRLQYLDIAWQTYLQEYHTIMPIDVWNFHLYVLPERRWGTNENSDGKIALGTDAALAKYDSDWGNPALCPLEEVHCRAEHSEVELFMEQVVALRSWMKTHGQQNKPLILSEYSLLYPYVIDDPNNPSACFLQDELGQCFTPERVTAYMDATFDYLETAVDPNLGYPRDGYRLVQQWLWYSMVTLPEESGGSSNLLVQNFADYPSGSTDALTLMGQNFLDEVAAQPVLANLVAEMVYGSVPLTSGEPTTATLTTRFYNNGNAAVTEPFEVTFYADEAQTQIIGTAVISPNVEGCGKPGYQASIQWSNLPAGPHAFWVEVDSADIILEPQTDNVASGLVIVAPHNIFLPVVVRTP